MPSIPLVFLRLSDIINFSTSYVLILMEEIVIRGFEQIFHSSLIVYVTRQ